MADRVFLHSVGALVALCICAALWPALCLGAPADVVTLRGRVRYAEPRTCLSPVMSRPDLKTATFTTDSGEVYAIEMDLYGAELAIVMNLERVTVRGVVSEKRDGRWLRVLGYADPALTAAHEYWRRICCNNCAVSAALVNAVRPRRLHGAQPVSGRYYARKAKVSAWTRDRKNLWVATDNRLLRIGLAERSVLASFDRTQGFPDSVVHALHSDGRMLLLATRCGVFGLAVHGGTGIRDAALMPGELARMVRDAETTWLVTDRATCRLAVAQRAPVVFRAIPTAGRIHKTLNDGVWLPHWRRQTAYLLGAPVLVQGRLFVESLGGIYGFDGAQWQRIARRGWNVRAGGGRLWYLTPQGVAEYEPAHGKRVVHAPGLLRTGRYTHLLATDRAVWVAAEPPELGGPVDADAGGLARFDLDTRRWQAWKRAQGTRLNHVLALHAEPDAAWAVNAEGRYRVTSADPGMLHVKRHTFDIDAVSLYRLGPEPAGWERIRLAPGRLEQRLICGHDGSRGMGGIGLQAVTHLAIGADRIFGLCRLAPTGFFGGYWPCVNQLAVRAPGAGQWRAAFVHEPAALNLAGEQPAILNISNSGRRILKAIGHDEVLDLFVHDGACWAVTEGCVALFEKRTGTWRRLYEAGPRYYWRATAAYDDRDGLYVGSDRGVVCRLDFATGRFTMELVLKDRTITRIFRDRAGRLTVHSTPAPLGRMPDRFAPACPSHDWRAAVQDGGTWRETPDPSAQAAAPGWYFKQVRKREPRDKSRGNFLWRAGPGVRGPSWYVKDVFFPLFLCASPDGKRLWISTFTGLLRLDVPEGH